ncbi:MAG TPA: sigma-54 dependent transcriptional regulator [Candidatus Krumholzibacteria bacterium]|nr:sigma-54 dependent transcriptional regulator [Candidatus Krumholzibacteria bacterium]HPD71459.1 sigma-54 dependent transcriptional regulator [Candidatus Krumholzibacteria bacterium]HRY41608.1 sigma-54 dependent transcriptional regulator [Candidatus Krumholzibacteria bacterium]
MSLGRILVVDDEESMCQYLSILLGKEGYEVQTANSGAAALRLQESAPCDVVMTDIQMPGMDGIQLLKGMRAVDPQMPIVIMTAYATEQSAIDAVNLGAFSYLQKTCKNDEIKIVIRNAMQLRRAESENRQLKRELKKKKSKQQMIGQSPRMRSVFKMIDKIAATPATVMIYGDSGTGKELVARAIHDRSHRAQGPFVAINCGAIPETLLESQLFGHVKGSFTGADRDHDGFCQQAEGGTIFLDEIGEMPQSTQVKLLRMLQEREVIPVGSAQAVKVDLRVIAATNRDLELEVAEGRFRTDLFFRLNVIPLKLPALRERIEDIPLLADHFLRRFLPEEYQGGLSAMLDDEAMQCLQSYEWPGNVRELENVIERACIMREGTRIGVRDLPPGLHGQTGAPVPQATLVGGMVSLEDLEKAHILQVLEAVAWHKKRAAEILQINPSTLYRKLLRYGVGQDRIGFEDDDDPDRAAADRVVDAVQSVGDDPEATADEPAAPRPEPVAIE